MPRTRWPTRPRAASPTTRARSVGSEYWDWLGIRAGVPVITGSDAGPLRAANGELGSGGGVNFRKGCYPGQEIVARMQYLGRMKERLFAFHVAAPPPAPATPLYHAAFGAQACGTVVNAAAAPQAAVTCWRLSNGPRLPTPAIASRRTGWPRCSHRCRCPIDIPAAVGGEHAAEAVTRVAHYYIWYRIAGDPRCRTRSGRRVARPPLPARGRDWTRAGAPR